MKKQCCSELVKSNSVQFDKIVHCASLDSGFFVAVRDANIKNKAANLGFQIWQILPVGGGRLLGGLTQVFIAAPVSEAGRNGGSLAVGLLSREETSQNLESSVVQPRRSRTAHEPRPGPAGCCVPHTAQTAGLPTWKAQGWGTSAFTLTTLMPPNKCAELENWSFPFYKCFWEISELCIAAAPRGSLDKCPLLSTDVAKAAAWAPTFSKARHPPPQETHSSWLWWKKGLFLHLPSFQLSALSFSTERPCCSPGMWCRLQGSLSPEQMALGLGLRFPELKHHISVTGRAHRSLPAGLSCCPPAPLCRAARADHAYYTDNSPLISAQCERCSL